MATWPQRTGREGLAWRRSSECWGHLELGLPALQEPRVPSQRVQASSRATPSPRRTCVHCIYGSCLSLLSKFNIPMFSCFGLIISGFPRHAPCSVQFICWSHVVMTEGRQLTCSDSTRGCLSKVDALAERYFKCFVFFVVSIFVHPVGMCHSLYIFRHL